jgi:hypothetical protein
MNDKVTLLPPRMGSIEFSERSYERRQVNLSTIEDVGRFANLFLNTGWNPKDMDTTEKLSVAIIYGMEFGLSPLMAMQKIAVINGRPTMWGDAVLALVQASGLLENIREGVEGKDYDRYGFCEVMRKGRTESTTRKFSMGDARRAKLLDKTGPWQTYPDRMLQMRARAFALRDTFPDVLGGMLGVREEEEDVLRSEMKDVTPEPPPPPPSSAKTPPPPPPPPPLVATQDAIDWAKDGVGDKVLKATAPPAENDEELNDGMPEEIPFPGDLPPPLSARDEGVLLDLQAMLEEYGDSLQHLNEWRRIADVTIGTLSSQAQEVILSRWTRRMSKF